MNEVFVGSGVEDDDDVDLTTGGAPAGSVLGDIAAELAADLRQKTIVLAVPGRDRYSVRYRTHIEHRRLQMLAKRCEDKQVAGRLDEAKYASLVLATYCDAVLREGSVVADSQGKDVTFSTEEFWDLLGVMNAAEAVRKFYGSDAVVMSTSVQVLRAAGYDQEVREADPTGAA